MEEIPLPPNGPDVLDTVLIAITDVLVKVVDLIGDLIRLF